MNNPSAVQETRVPSLGREEPLEEEMATHSNILAWKIPWTEEPGGLQSMGFPRQEDWSGLLFPTPRDLPDPGIEPMSLPSTLVEGSLPLLTPGKQI